MEYVAVIPHRSKYPNPVRLEPGEVVNVGCRDRQYPGWIWVTTRSGVEGWAPESLIRIDGRGSGVATSAYTARELDTQAGERLSCLLELEGWLWVENEKGQSGWIPKETVRALCP